MRGVIGFVAVALMSGCNGAGGVEWECAAWDDGEVVSHGRMSCQDYAYESVDRLGDHEADCQDEIGEDCVCSADTTGCGWDEALLASGPAPHGPLDVDDQDAESADP